MSNLLLASPSATIDIIALILFIVLALFGLIQGFTKTFFSLFGTMIAIIIALLLSSPVINWLQESFNAISTMSNSVSGVANDLFGKELMQTKLSVANESFLNNAGISWVFAKIILSVKKAGTIPEGATVSDVICPTIAYYIVLIIAVVILFILLKILFAIISKIVKSAYKSRSVASIDRVLGLILGILHGIITIELIIMFIGVLPIDAMQSLYADIQASSFAKFIQDINLVGILRDKIVDANITETIKQMIIK